MFKDKKTGFLILHLVIALVIFPVYLIPGELFKIVLLPYVCFMVWQKKAIFLPALIVHFTAGTTVSLFMLLTALVVCLLNLKTLKMHNLLRFFRAYIILLPIFAFLFYKNWVLEGISFSLSLSYTAFYLGISTFFYGVIISPQFNKTIYKYIVAVFFILPFYSFLPLDFTVRLYWLSLPFFLSLFLVRFTKLKKFFNLKFFGLSTAFTLIFILFFGTKFTLLVSGLMAFIIFYLLAKQKNYILNFFKGYRLLLVSTAIVVFVIVGSSDNSVYDVVEKELDSEIEVSFSNIDNLWTTLRYKAFDDRGMVWKGGWYHLLDINHFWPTGDVPIYSYEMASGSVIKDVTYGIHNIGLELMRKYGIIFGAYITILYVFILGFLSKAARQTKDYDLKFALAVCIGVGFVGGMVGQFVLQPTFSFAFLSLAGIFYAKKTLDDTTTQN